MQLYIFITVLCFLIVSLFLWKNEGVELMGSFLNESGKTQNVPSLALFVFNFLLWKGSHRRDHVFHLCVSVCCQIYVGYSEVITIKFDTVTASFTRMHHMLTILTLTLIHGHTDLNHENNEGWNILETVQASHVFWPKVYIILSQFDDLNLHSRSQSRLRLDKCLLVPKTINTKMGHHGALLYKKWGSLSA